MLIDAVNKFDLNTFFVVAGAVGSILVQIILAIAPSSWQNKWDAMTAEDKRRVFLIVFLALAAVDFALKGPSGASDAMQGIINWFTAVISASALFAGTKNIIKRSSEIEERITQ